MEYRFADPPGHGRETDAGGWYIEGAVLSSMGRLADGHSLNPRLADVRDNLALLLDHRHEAAAIVGQVRDVRPSGDGLRLLGDVTIAPGRFADLAKGGISMPLSIGFEPPRPDGRWRLREVSIVATPMDGTAQTGRDDVVVENVGPPLWLL